ncbi:MAG: hypothetical protein ACFFDK_04000 [Promethearchaeota archaeon]
MDTGIDFVQPEFLNILFFQQKNLIIFPYVDLKHLHALELFTVGYNVIDLESTALYNIKEIIEFEANNSYSQNRTFFFIYNLDIDKIKDIIEIADIRCILNTNEDVRRVINGNSFIFYNKKNSMFLNFDLNTVDLEFEKHLISSSENETLLYEKIQQIKIVATKIFMEINSNPNFIENLPEILKDYDSRFWVKILDFTKHYFKIEIPKINLENKKEFIKKSNFELKEMGKLNEILREYESIISLNKHIAKEFVQLLHEYRSNRVNPSNLDLEQLYNPQKLYQYLRTHHWSKEIPMEFLQNWIEMQNTGYKLSLSDLNDFQMIFQKLKIKEDYFSNDLTEGIKQVNINANNHYIEDNQNKFEKNQVYNKSEKSVTVKNFQKFKEDLLKKLESLEKIIDKLKYNNI